MNPNPPLQYLVRGQLISLREYHSEKIVEHSRKFGYLPDDVVPCSIRLLVKQTGRINQEVLTDIAPIIYEHTACANEIVYQGERVNEALLHWFNGESIPVKNLSDEKYFLTVRVSNLEWVTKKHKSSNDVLRAKANGDPIHFLQTAVEPVEMVTVKKRMMELSHGR